jgi:hypothetical protein
MTALKLAFIQFFTAFTMLGKFAESVMQTLLNISTVAEESSGAFMDQARIDRAAAKSKAEADLRASIAADNAPRIAP